MFRLRAKKSFETANERLLAIDRLDQQSAEFLLVKPEISIGSDDTNDIVIRSPTVSRRHAKLVRQQAHYELTDLGSTNGTLVNSRRIVSPASVAPGDEMRFGDVRLVLANLSAGGGQASSLKGMGSRRFSGRGAFELALAAFFIGFGIAQYLAYMLYHEQNRLILAEAVPLPRIEATNKASAPAPFYTTTPAGSFEASAPRSNTHASSPSIAPEASVPVITTVPTATPESNFSLGESRHPESHSYGSKPLRNELAGAMAVARLLPGSGRASGELAPAFRLQNTHGEWVSFPSLRGKVVLLNFWATWCPACRKEMPSLEGLYGRLHAEKGFALLTVSVDQQGAAAVGPFLDRTGYDFPVLLDQTDQVSSQYNVSGIPATFLIDGDGELFGTLPVALIGRIRKYFQRSKSSFRSRENFFGLDNHFIRSMFPRRSNSWASRSRDSRKAGCAIRSSAGALLERLCFYSCRNEYATSPDGAACVLGLAY